VTTPGERVARAVTIKDVARLAGVSISSASRALAGAGGVRPEVEVRIAEAAAKLQYRPNAAARSLRKSRTATFGILFNNLAGPDQLDLLKGVGAFCSAGGYSLLAADARSDHDLYLQMIARFFEQRVEGLFLVSPIDLRESLADYRRCGVPVITLLRKDASAGLEPLVAASEKHAITQAVSDLVELGHSRIAYFMRFWDDRRIRDIADALAALGLAPSQWSRQFDDPNLEPVRGHMTRALQRPDRPTAALVPVAYLGTMRRVLRELGVEAGREVSPISLGSSSWNQALAPEISTIEADGIAIGQLAGRVMADCLIGKQIEPAYTEVAEWRRRESVAPPPPDAEGP
jgi:DNA-binding LacI/PurR family transcriptional regulator